MALLRVAWSFGLEAERERARQAATLPMRMGGLGLRSTQEVFNGQRTGLREHMIRELNPEVAAMPLS